MANKAVPGKSTPQEIPPDALARLQETGLGNMLGMSAAWMETLSDVGTEVMGFVADRIKEDVKTQHEILHCKNVSELQHIQAQFMQKTIEQYQAETGKLVEMSTAAFARNTSGKTR